jgi:hypothetical protein
MKLKRHKYNCDDKILRISFNPDDRNKNICRLNDSPKKVQ